MITGSICLSKIPKDKITTGNDGLKYINIVISERKEVDKYGNTHFIAMNQKKDEREAGEQRVYIGQGIDRSTPKQDDSSSVFLEDLLGF
jgi:hypothetical protein